MSSAVSSADARRSRGIRRRDRDEALRLRAAPHLPAPRKYLRRLRRDGTRHSLLQFLGARVGNPCKNWLERHRFLGRCLRAARGAFGRRFKRLLWRVFHARRFRNYLWSPKKFVAAIGVKDLVLVETAD